MPDRRTKKGFFSRLTLGRAIALSIVLHLVAVIGSELTLPDFYTPPDEILNRKQPEHVQRVRIAVAPKPKPVSLGPRFISSAPKIEKSKEPAPKPAEEKSDISPIEADATAASDDSSDSTTAGLATENAVDAGAPIAPAAEPAPAFPVQVCADLELRVNSLTTIAEQHWGMEGFRYSISVNARKFGVKVQLESEGEIDSDGGLRPDKFRMSVNNKVRNSADYRNGALTYGKSSMLKTEIMATPPQDMASLPFHVAVTFNGSPQTIKVTTGKSLYEVRLVLDAEETLKLPVGTLRTLHLRGERYNPEDGSLIAGYEVWLAPDYLNYPVKFIGRTGNGDSVEYRVRRLEIEGKNVLGDPADHILTPADDDIPEWLKNRVKETSGDSTDPIKMEPTTLP